MCGEKPQDYTGHKLAVGSPPHVRGKVPFPIFHCFCRGITPACAGKSVRPQNARRAGQDHPRMCGEKTKKIP